MPNAWNELEINATIKEYFNLLEEQENEHQVNKAAVYRALSEKFPNRSPKSFEFKFQNISAILYEEKMPYLNGLLPRKNYQNLLRILVVDYLGKTKFTAKLPIEILVQKMRSIHKKGFVPVSGTGAGRYGLTLEQQLGIPQNSSKEPDFMGIELKTKHNSNLQTLFSKIPTEYITIKDKKELILKYGYRDQNKERQALYTSFNNTHNSLGFYLKVMEDNIVVFNKEDIVLTYDLILLEESLLSKHSESAYIKVLSKNKDGTQTCRFEDLLYCKNPSILKFKNLVSNGKIYLDFTMSLKDDKAKDHGFLWRIEPESLKDLYLSTQAYNIAE